jgi:hypothetical protein
MHAQVVAVLFLTACVGPASPVTLYEGQAAAPVQFGGTSDTIVVLDELGAHEIDMSGAERPLLAAQAQKLVAGNGWVTWAQTTATGATVWRRGGNGVVESIDVAPDIAEQIGLVTVTGGIVVKASQDLYWGDGAPVPVDLQIVSPVMSDGDWIYGFQFSGALSRVRFDGSGLEQLGVSLSYADAIAARGDRFVYTTYHPSNIYVQRVLEKDLATGVEQDLGEVPKVGFSSSGPPSIVIDREQLFVGSYRYDGSWTRFLPVPVQQDYTRATLVGRRFVWVDDGFFVPSTRVLATDADGDALPDSTEPSDDRGPFQ